MIICRMTICRMTICRQLGMTPASQPESCSVLSLVTNLCTSVSSVLLVIAQRRLVQLSGVFLSRQIAQKNDKMPKFFFWQICIRQIVGDKLRQSANFSADCISANRTDPNQKHCCLVWNYKELCNKDRQLKNDKNFVKL